jgi:hypothetical protein
VLFVVVEVQRQQDDRKRFTWPYYLVAARAQHECPGLLMVLTHSSGVAQWARAPIKIGPRGFCLEPCVISYSDVPLDLDLSQTERVPELAVLSALAHPSLQTAKRAVDVIRGLSPELTKLYFDAIAAALPEEDRPTLEAIVMEGYVYQSDFARRYVAQGREEGREEGLHLAVLELARDKLPLSAADEAAIRALRDPAVLTELNVALGRARNARQARAALERARR